MDIRLMSDSVASIQKAPEEFLTPSFRELRTETHADIDQLRGDVEALRSDIAQLRGESTQSRQEADANFARVRGEISQVRSEAQQFRAETAANFAQVCAEAAVNFAQVREDISSLHDKVYSLSGEVSTLRSAMERGFAEIGAKLDLQADVQRLKEQVASLQAGQQTRALETH